MYLTAEFKGSPSGVQKRSKELGLITKPRDFYHPSRLYGRTLRDGPISTGRLAGDDGSIRGFKETGTQLDINKYTYIIYIYIYTSQNTSWACHRKTSWPNRVLRQKEGVSSFCQRVRKWCFPMLNVKPHPHVIFAPLNRVFLPPIIPHQPAPPRPLEWRPTRAWSSNTYAQQMKLLDSSAASA